MNYLIYVKDLVKGGSYSPQDLVNSVKVRDLVSFKVLLVGYSSYS